MSEKFVTVAKIGAPYSVRGELKLHSFTDPASRIFDYQDLFYKKAGQWQVLPAFKLRKHGDKILILFESFQDRDLAKQFVNLEIGVARDALPEPQEDEFYWADLEGMRVINAQNVELGTVSNVFNAGASDVLDIKGAHPCLIPFVAQYIIKVEPKEQLIRVDWDLEFNV